MKVRLTYTGDDLEDRDELETIQNAKRWRYSLAAGFEELRRLLKYGEHSEETRTALESVREAMCNELSGYEP